MTDLEHAQFASAMSWPRRGGFWRRFIASFIDYLVVLIPIFALVATLFSLTDGGVKGSFWLNWRICQEGTLHGNPSLTRYNWQVCRTSVFGLTVAEWAVGTTSDAQTEGSSAISIDLDPLGNFRSAAMDAGFLEMLVLTTYLFLMELKSGQSLGKRVMTIMVHDQDDKSRVGLPVQKAMRRQAMKLLGPLSMALTGGWFAFRAWGNAPGVAQDFSWLEITGAYAAFVLALIWPIWIAISIALGNEPIHDRFAGTTVRAYEILA